MTAVAIAPTDLQQASHGPSPISHAPAAPFSPIGQHADDPRSVIAGGGTDSERGLGAFDTQSTRAPLGPFLDDPSIALAADILDDAERNRIANENRLRQFTRTDVDADGIERGFGLDASVKDIAVLESIVTLLGQVEHEAALQLRRKVRAHPLWDAFGKGARGVGEKQFARLLASIGDPYWNTLHDRPRTVSELWAYAGFHTLPTGRTSRDDHPENAGGEVGSDTDHIARDDHVVNVRVAARRKKGQQSNWSTNAKMRAYLIAESCMKAGNNPYRDAYDQRREHTAITHPDWTLGHSHNDALRYASKRILRDLWRASRDIHNERAEA